eukprot:gene12165-5655_t
MRVSKVFNKNFKRYYSFDAWAKIEPIGLDAIKQLTINYQKDPSPEKVLLGEGVYRDNDGKPVILKSVRKAEEVIFESKLDHEYAPVSGIQKFCDLSREFAFGKDSKPLQEERIATVQTISGTGSLRLAGQFLKKFLPEGTNFYVPQPTWGNHIPIFENSGFKLSTYRYFDKKTSGMDAEGCLEDLKNAPNRSVVLLHACAHNPTGVDPTAEVWKKISQVCLEKEHICYFDSAYQGFASGDPEHDASAFRQFVKDGHCVLVSSSYAKNFGLYGERTGALNVVCKSKEQAAAVHSQLSVLIRGMYSTPPIYGARIVSTVFSTPELKSMWEKDVKEMADRIKTMRDQLVTSLKSAGSTKNWDHITNQIGMFAFSGLSPEEVEAIKEKHHIYMTKDGRISISGLNTKNVDTVAKAIHDVTK